MTLADDIASADEVAIQAQHDYRHRMDVELEYDLNGGSKIKHEKAEKEQEEKKIEDQPEDKETTTDDL